MSNNNLDNQIHKFIEMIGAMASLNFSKRLEADINDDPVNVLAYGLNMLSEELEQNVVKKSRLTEVNTSLEKFSYTVAHDIRSPLNSAIGITSLLEMELGQDMPPHVAEYFSLLKQVHQRIADMVKGILDYSKADFNTLHTEAIDIQSMCHDIAEEFDSRKITLRILFPEAVPVIQYNKLAIWQLFSNLIGNAVKYNDKEACEITVNCKEREQVYELSIKDNGPGIPADKLEKIFDLFENFKSEDNNSYGVGLSIVKKIVNQSNGEIWVQSEPGNGTNFIFTVAKN